MLGFAWLILHGGLGRSAYLRLILVDPAAKGAGVGGALLQELEARDLSPGGLLLRCTSDNVGARAFYERAGYQRGGELPGYVGPGLDETIYFQARPGWPPVKPFGLKTHAGMSRCVLIIAAAASSECA